MKLMAAGKTATQGGEPIGEKRIQMAQQINLLSDILQSIEEYAAESPPSQEWNHLILQLRVPYIPKIKCSRCQRKKPSYNFSDGLKTCDPCRRQKLTRRIIKDSENDSDA